MGRVATAVSALLLSTACVLAAGQDVEINALSAEGTGKSLGSVSLSETDGGVAIKVSVSGIADGEHGFHVHEKPSCDPATAADGKVTPAGGAGAHLDPAKTGAHMGPEGAGHLGDLPKVTVGADGTAKATLSAPHIKTAADLKGHALMLHAGGDNYSDQPAPLGGGGARMACGVAQ